MKRCVVRLEEDAIRQLDQLAVRLREQTNRSWSRAAVVRLFVTGRLADIGDDRPLGEQLTLIRPLPSVRWRPPSSEHTLRDRIVARMAANPEETFTPALLAPLVGATSRDTVRNTLLVLAVKGRIMKIGEGQYRAQGGDAPPSGVRWREGDQEPAVVCPVLTATAREEAPVEGAAAPACATASSDHTASVSGPAAA